MFHFIKASKFFTIEFLHRKVTVLDHYSISAYRKNYYVMSRLTKKWNFFEKSTYTLHTIVYDSLYKPKEHHIEWKDDTMEYVENIGKIEDDKIDENPNFIFPYSLHKINKIFIASIFLDVIPAIIENKEHVKNNVYSEFNLIISASKNKTSIASTDAFCSTEFSDDDEINQVDVYIISETNVSIWETIWGTWRN